jgi:hypothetical protein
VIFTAIERDRLIEVHEVAIDAGADVAFLGVLFEFLFVFAFTAANNRSEDHNAVIGFQREDGLYDLLGRLASNRIAAIGAVGRADGAVDHAQVIVNFCDGADGGTRRARGGFLLDSNRGREAFDGIDVRALHLV